MIELDKIKIGLVEYKKQDVDNYCNYIISSGNQKNGKGEFSYPFFKDLSEKTLVDYFKKVSNEGLVFDGKHITIGKLGIQYDYVAYKNKMLLAYPESKIDVQLVYKNDIFNVAKESGDVIYSHTIIEPFNRTDNDIIGAYCVIKNNRGQFLTTLTRLELDKHRKIAKTDYIWKDWVVEMASKTVIKKAIKFHFDDIYKTMEEEDNKNYDLEKFIDQLEEIKTIAELEVYYNENKEKAEDKAIFNKMIKDKKILLTPKNNENL